MARECICSARASRHSIPPGRDASLLAHLVTIRLCSAAVGGATILVILASFETKPEVTSPTVYRVDAGGALWTTRVNQ